MKSHGLTLEKFVKKQGLDKTFFECERRMWRLGSREPPRGIQYDGGSDWVGLHIDFVRYLIHEVNTDPLLKGMQQIQRWQSYRVNKLMKKLSTLCS